MTRHDPDTTPQEEQLPDSPYNPMGSDELSAGKGGGC